MGVPPSSPTWISAAMPWVSASVLFIRPAGLCVRLNTMSLVVKHENFDPKTCSFLRASLPLYWNLGYLYGVQAVQPNHQTRCQTPRTALQGMPHAQRSRRPSKPPLASSASTFHTTRSHPPACGHPCSCCKSTNTNKQEWRISRVGRHCHETGGSQHASAVFPMPLSVASTGIEAF